MLKWRPEQGYRIALINGSSRFDGNFLGSLSSKSLEERDPVYGMEPGKDGSLNLVGPNGLYRLKGNQLTTFVRFAKSRQIVHFENLNYHWEFDPSCMLSLDEKRWLLAGTFGGVYLLERSERGGYTFTALDEELGTPMRW